MLNFGPQHPAAHGVLRLVLSLNGEVGGVFSSSVVPFFAMCRALSCCLSRPFLPSVTPFLTVCHALSYRLSRPFLSSVVQFLAIYRSISCHLLCHFLPSDVPFLAVCHALYYRLSRPILPPVTPFFAVCGIFKAKFSFRFHIICVQMKVFSKHFIWPACIHILAVQMLTI